jgi:hypothetical protein
MVNRGRSVAGARARYTSVKALRQAGFRVWHSPTALMKDHVSVQPEGEWSDAVCDRLEACFTDEA